MNHQRENLDYALELRAEDISEAGTFTAYASVFNEADSGGMFSPPDVVLPGAFAKTLSKMGRNGNGIPMLWQHNPDWPIGIFSEMTEDNRGLKVKGELNLKIQQARDAHALLLQGAVKGLSIGFETIDADFDKEKKIRTLKEIELWETSLVTFPRQKKATVLSVKNAATPRELEKALREGGLSISDAKRIVSMCKAGLREEDGETQNDEAERVLATLREERVKLALFNATAGLYL